MSLDKKNAHLNNLLDEFKKLHQDHDIYSELRQSGLKYRCYIYIYKNERNFVYDELPRYKKMIKTRWDEFGSQLIFSKEHESLDGLLPAISDGIKTMKDILSGKIDINEQHGE